MQNNITTNPWDVLPPAFLDKVKEVVPAEKLNSVLGAFCVERPTTFRANTLKISSDKLADQLSVLNIPFERVDWYSDAFILQTTKNVLMDTDLYNNGFLYIQSLSSMIPSLVMDPQANETVCDLTAAPGSKTTQMAAMMANTGSIVANDKSKVRLYKLQSNLAVQGVTNTQTTYLPGQVFWKNYPEYFDKTLVDVPCSLEGRINCLNPKTYKDWTPKKPKELSQIQKFLLRAGISTTKVGGTIVYSTCTLSPEENEGVLDWILEKEKGAVEMESIELLVPDKYPGVTQWGNKNYNPQVAKALRIFPSETMEGFFVAKLKKIKSNISPLTTQY